MSRSFRKPYVNDSYKGSGFKQFAKRESNKKIRKSEDIPNGKSYRKYFDPWNINDYYYYVGKDLKYWPEWWKLLRK